MENEPELIGENEMYVDTEINAETVDKSDMKEDPIPDTAEHTKTGFQKFLRIWNSFWKWVFHLRSIGVVIPIAIIAISLAIHNEARLPEQVGFNIQSTGEYEQLVDRDVAVYGPLVLTGICLFLTLCSRRILFPCMISVFTLVLPVFIWITNTFPN